MHWPRWPDHNCFKNLHVIFFASFPCKLLPSFSRRTPAQPFLTFLGRPREAWRRQLLTGVSTFTRSTPARVVVPHADAAMASRLANGLLMICSVNVNVALVGIGVVRFHPIDHRMRDITRSSDLQRWPPARIGFRLLKAVSGADSRQSFRNAEPAERCLRFYFAPETELPGSDRKMRSVLRPRASTAVARRKYHCGFSHFSSRACGMGMRLPIRKSYTSRSSARRARSA
jgi:hypothetical protein